MERKKSGSGFKMKSPLKTRLGRFLLGRKKRDEYFKETGYKAIVDKKGYVVKDKQVNPDGSVTKRKFSRKVRKQIHG
tara:strand:+ start:66 stop:296 length:231 start_codon:yes stop_codon:yes gene_type:complete